MRSPRSPLPVAFAGARGAYGQLAARRFFGATVATLPAGDVEGALATLADGRASAAVLALENAITGPFSGLVEALFDEPGVPSAALVGEVVLPIRHALLGVPGTRLEELSVVTSHPSALAQCRDWLARWGVSTRPAEDTAHAAQELAAADDRGLGVLGSRELAATYGLALLAEGIADRPNNHTRFLVFAPAPEREVTDRATRTALLVGPGAPPRTLKTLRIQLESLGARRVRVPVVGAADGARFLVEFDHDRGAGADLAARASGELSVRHLGSWTPESTVVRVAG